MEKLFYSVLYNIDTEKIIAGHGPKINVFRKLKELNKDEKWIIQTMIEIDDEIYNLLTGEN